MAWSFDGIPESSLLKDKSLEFKSSYRTANVDQLLTMRLRKLSYLDSESDTESIHDPRLEDDEQD